MKTQNLAFSIKYQHGFRGSCQANSQIYVKDQKSKVVNTPSKNYLLEEGKYARPVIKTYYKLLIVKKIWQSYWHMDMKLD